MKLTQRDLDQIVDSIVNAVHPQKIFLFGSAVRGEMTAESDYDLLVVMPEGVHRRKTAQFLYRHLGNSGIPVDILVATPEDLEKHKENIGLIYRTVLEEGQEIYHRS